MMIRRPSFAHENGFCSVVELDVIGAYGGSMTLIRAGRHRVIISF